MLRSGHRLLVMVLQDPSYQHCKFNTVAKTVEEITIPVPWGHVAGKWWGDRNVQPVLGLHGWEDNAGTFDTLAPLLNLPSFLAIDLMGHGMSSYYPLGCTHEFVDSVILIKRIINHYQWNKISFIGHSFGSAMAYLYCALYPEEVEKYVSIDCARSLLLPPKGKYIQQTRDTLDKTLNIEKKLGTDPPSYTYDDLLQRVYQGSGKSPTLESCAVLMKRGLKTSSQDSSKCYLSRDPRVKLNWLGKMPEELVMGCASRIECKVLSIRGKQGFLFNGDERRVYESSLKLLKHCEHHDIEGSHHIHLNNPENPAAPVTSELQHNSEVLIAMKHQAAVAGEI
ncbi:hypothetical protein L9F63_023210, partial [Diploptera punctata]